MKKTFINTLTKLAERDKDIYLLTGDLGFSIFEDFAKKFPDRFIDCGVAEQTMAGIAAGLALCGKKPYIYSIVPFVTMRCFEQIRNDICYQNLNVKIIGIGAGFSYGSLGSTHHAIEDISIFRSLPNITIISPADSVEAEKLILESYKINGPVYIRLDKSENFIIDKEAKIKISEPNIIKQGKDVVVFTTGACLNQALEVANKLAQEKISIGIVSLHTLKPIRDQLIMNELKNKKAIFVLEEHKGVGGLSSLMSEVITRNNIIIYFTSISLPQNLKSRIGSQSFLKQRNNINIKYLYKKINSFLQNGK